MLSSLLRVTDRSAWTWSCGRWGVKENLGQGKSQPGLQEGGDWCALVVCLHPLSCVLSPKVSFLCQSWPEGRSISGVICPLVISFPEFSKVSQENLVEMGWSWRQLVSELRCQDWESSTEPLTSHHWGPVNRMEEAGAHRQHRLHLKQKSSNGFNANIFVGHRQLLKINVLYQRQHSKV